MSVWHNEEFDWKGPTLNSLLEIVRLNGSPCCDVKVKDISAGKPAKLLHAIPYVPGSSGFG